jgi:hypothetical protein
LDHAIEYYLEEDTEDLDGYDEEEEEDY